MIRTTAGSIVLNNGTAPSDDTAVSANGSGNILIQALGAGTDITANADIVSGSGNVSALAARSVSFTGTADIRTTSTAAGSGSIDVLAGTGSIAQSATSVFLSTGATATARLLAATDVTVGDIELTLGQVSITATSGSILDADVVTTTNDADQDVTASALRLVAGTAIGESVDHLETTVGTLSARAGNGSIYVLEADALTVDDVGLSVNRVGSDGTTLTTTTDAAQSDIRSTGGTNGNVVLVAGGTVTLNDGTANGGVAGAAGTAVSANGSGSVLIDVNAGDLVVNADIVSGTGHVTLKAAGSVLLGSATASGVDVSTATGGTISIDAEGAALTMAGDAKVTATGSSVRLNAATDVTLGNVVATSVSVVADTGAIVNATGSTKNVTATNLRLQADDAIGVSGRHLTTDVTTLTARSTGTNSAGIFVTEDSALTVDTVAVSVTEFSATAGTSTVSDASQSDVVAGTNGNVVLVAGGTVTLNDGTANGGVAGVAGVAVSANGSGSVLIDVNAGDLVVNADIVSGTGHVTLKAAGSVLLGSATASGVDVSTATGGTISIDAEGAALTMAGDAKVTATGSSVRLNAATDVTLGNVVATSVSVVADTGAIVNATGSTKNVTATNLRLQADDAIGVSGRHLTTDVTTLTARSTGTNSAGIFVSEDSALTVSSVAVTVTEFMASAGTVTVKDETQSDLVALGGGDIRLAAGGTVTLQDAGVGVQGDNKAVVTDGAGRVSIESATGALIIDAAISTDSGSVDLRSQLSIIWQSGTVESSKPIQDTQLTIRPVDSSQALLIGGSAADTGWRFSADDLMRLKAGYEVVIIGGDNHTGAVKIDGSVNALSFANPVEIKTAVGASVEIKGDIRADSLRVDGDAPVKIVNATLTLSESAGLNIRGKAELSGDVTIKASSLSFEGGTGSLTAAPGARLTLLPETAGQTIVIGSAAAAGGASFAMGDRELKALGDGFASIEIGHSDRSANLRVEGAANFSDAVTLWGKSLSMAAGSSLTSTADVTVMAAGDVRLSQINAAGQTVTVRAEGTGSTVQTLAGQSGVNIVAANVVVEGFGPVDGQGGALRVNSGQVNLFTPNGMVLRQTQTNGEVHFLVMVDGVSYLQVVNTQRDAVASGKSVLPAVQSSQGTVAPLVLSGGRAWALSADTTPTLYRTAAASGTAVAQSASGWSLAQAQRFDAQVARLASADITWTSDSTAASDQADDSLHSAFLLGSPAAQPLSAGLSAGLDAPFDYWVETLTL